MPGNRDFRLLVAATLFSRSAAGSGGCQLATPAPPYGAPATLPPELLPPPAAEGSPAWHEDLALIVAAQNGGFGLDELSAMHAEQHLKLELMTDVLGPHFERSTLPKTFALLENVLTDATLVTEADKTYWNTRRPYVADSRVKLLIDPPADSLSLPERPCLRNARVLAEVLALLVPQKRRRAAHARRET